jgi:hypothetical protein
VGDRVWEEGFLLGPISGDVLLGQWDAGLAREVEFGGEGDASLMTPLVIAECARGDVERARSRVDSYSHLKASDDLQARFGYLFAEAHVLRAEGKPREALESLEPVFTGGMGITFLTVKLSLVEALEAAFELGDTRKLEELLGSIEALRPGDRPRLLAAHARRFRSKLDGDEAGYRAAQAVFRELELPFWLAVTLLEHGEATGNAPLVAEARELFAKLGATPWLERAEASLPAGREPEAVPA